MALQSFPPDSIADFGVRPCEGECKSTWAAHAARQREQASHRDKLRPFTVPNGTAVQSDPVSGMLFGLNLELVRHSMFAGLSAQLIANRLFASKTGGWPPARWHAVGTPVLHEPGFSGRNGTYAVRCTLRQPSDVCGVSQTQVEQGFSSGPNNGSAIAVEAGRCYSARLVLRSAASGSPVGVHATLSDDGDARLLASWTGRLHRGAWQTVRFNFTAPATSRSAALRVVGACQPAAGKPASASRATPTNSAQKCNTTFWIGALSLMPCDHVHGARADVLALLTRLNFRGPLRWPGGCFSSIAPQWREGLLPPDERPPVHNPPDAFCNAVQDGQFAYTDGSSENWPGVDEYFALARLMGATPAIGLKLNFGSAEEVQDAADFLEYCNGDNTTTRLGRERMARGHAEPYGVRVVYLGNEIGAQPRFTSRAPCAVPSELHELVDLRRRTTPLYCRGAPRAGIACDDAYVSHPEQRLFKRCTPVGGNCTDRGERLACAPPPKRVDAGKCSALDVRDRSRPDVTATVCPAATPREYRDMLPSVTQALLRVDPAVQMVASNANPNLTAYDGSLTYAWATREMEAWIKRPWGYLHNHSSRRGLWANSYHLYVRQPYEWSPETMTQHAISAARIALPALQAHRTRLDTLGKAHHAQISLDEWGSGPPWKAPSMGTPHALFAAALMIQLIKNARPLKLVSANLYAPVNEGAITVGRFTASLTPLGQAMQMIAEHQGRHLISMPPRWGSSELGEVEAVGTASEAAEQRPPDFLYTLANCNAAAAHTRLLDVPLGGQSSDQLVLEAAELRAEGIDPVSSGKLGDIGSFTQATSHLSVACSDGGNTDPAWAPHEAGGVQCSAGTRLLAVRVVVPPFSLVHLKVSLRVS